MKRTLSAAPRPTRHRRRQVVAFSLVSTVAVSMGAAQVSATTPADLEVQPLTGLPIDGTLVTYTPRPAMVVKIDNVQAEPQSGLNQADIVFEEIVEGRATRFAAVFNSQDSDPVGPIRSGRTQDINITANLNDPVFVWSGGNAGVTNALQGTGMTLLDQGAPSMHRDSTYHGSPHNLFANTSELWAHAGESGNAEPIFEYTAMGAEIPGPGVTSIDLLIGSYRVNWAYDAEQGLFLRSQLGDAHETTTGQVSTNNIVVLLTGYGTSPFGGPEAVTVGEGEVVVYAHGHKIEGHWSRATPTDPYTLTTADGQPIQLQPGRTFVEIVDGAAYELTDDAA
jgi:hypothetical protein